MTALSPLTLDNKGKPHGWPAYCHFLWLWRNHLYAGHWPHSLWSPWLWSREAREYLDESISTGEKTFRGASWEMWGSLHVTLDGGSQDLEEPSGHGRRFKDFFNYTTQHKIPFNVISAGLKPLLRHVLDETMGEEQSARIGIVSKWRENHWGRLGVDTNLETWQRAWSWQGPVNSRVQRLMCGRDSTHCVYWWWCFGLGSCWSGWRPLCKTGLKLEQYCIKNKIPYIPYNSFSDIKRNLHVLVDGNENHLKSDDSITVSVAPSGSSSIPPGSNYGSGSSSDEESVSSLHSIEKRPPLRSMLSGVAYAV